MQSSTECCTKIRATELTYDAQSIRKNMHNAYPCMSAHIVAKFFCSFMYAFNDLLVCFNFISREILLLTFFSVNIYGLFTLFAI
jgi:hypothetical protein